MSERSDGKERVPYEIMGVLRFFDADERLSAKQLSEMIDLALAFGVQEYKLFSSEVEGYRYTEDRDTRPVTRTVYGLIHPEHPVDDVHYAVKRRIHSFFERSGGLSGNTAGFPYAAQPGKIGGFLVVEQDLDDYIDGPDFAASMDNILYYEPDYGDMIPLGSSPRMSELEDQEYWNRFDAHPSERE